MVKTLSALTRLLFGEVSKSVNDKNMVVTMEDVIIALETNITTAFMRSQHMSL